jgi:hypothetical protein
MLKDEALTCNNLWWECIGLKKIIVIKNSNWVFNSLSSPHHLTLNSPLRKICLSFIQNQVSISSKLFKRLRDHHFISWATTMQHWVKRNLQLRVNYSLEIDKQLQPKLWTIHFTILNKCSLKLTIQLIFFRIMLRNPEIQITFIKLISNTSKQH